MVLCPEIQSKGQEEIDRVIGKDRLPSFTDRDSLPYVNAIVKEVLRWNPAVPLGMAKIVLPYFLLFNCYIVQAFPTESLKMTHIEDSKFGRAQSYGLTSGEFISYADTCPSYQYTIRSMLHDEQVFPQPDKFIPERYLGKDESEYDRSKDPSILAFGFGRR